MFFKEFLCFISFLIHKFQCDSQTDSSVKQTAVSASKQTAVSSQISHFCFPHFPFILQKTVYKIKYELRTQENVIHSIKTQFSHLIFFFTKVYVLMGLFALGESLISFSSCRLLKLKLSLFVQLISSRNFKFQFFKYWNVSQECILSKCNSLFLFLRYTFHLPVENILYLYLFTFSSNFFSHIEPVLLYMYKKCYANL